MMIKQLMLHKFAESELERLQVLRGELIDKLKVSPEGSLSVHCGVLYRTGRYQGKKYQIPLRGDQKLYRALKDKRQMKACLPVLNSRIRVLEDFIKNDVLYEPQAICDNLVRQYHGVEGNLIRLEGDINIEEWANAPYKKNPYPYTEEHYTRGGKRARSKSESMIGTEIEYRELFFRIDGELKLENRVVYPDFAIVLPLSRRIIYWEHLGRIDLESYVFDNLDKLTDYARNGIYLGINLFITYETKEHPLNILQINETIDAILALDYDPEKIMGSN